MFQSTSSTDYAAQCEIEDIARHSDSIDDRLDHADFQIQRLLMITEALWQILKEQHGYDDGELMLRIAAIDMQDGKLDGKVAQHQPENCPKCDRVMGRCRANCIYCGAAITRSPFERD